jgi:hypothetical protein
MDSDTEKSQENDSSSDDEVYLKVDDIKAYDVKLQQKRRVARKKRGGDVVNKLEGLQSYDTLLKAQALKRMQEGLTTLLSLHGPVELSSLCGSLGLKVQQKGNISMEQIIQYAIAHEEISEERLKHILRYMWEGAMWEYLHSIGHPVHNMLLDPRNTIYELWEKGGFLDHTGNFIPHFIVRQVKNRFDGVTSTDIQERLISISIAQEKAKIAERKVISEHDYTNILSYFKQMSNLRSLENSIRDYLIAELEIARSHIDTLQETTKTLRLQLSDNELQFMKVTETLNIQLAHAEYLRYKAIHERFEIENCLQRTSTIIQSYMDTEENRQLVHGGTIQPLKIRHQDTIPSYYLQDCLMKLQAYRDQRDEHDSHLRFRCRSHIQEIDELKQTIQDMEEEYSSMKSQNQMYRKHYEKLFEQFIIVNRKLIRIENSKQHELQFAWKSTTNLTAKLLEQQIKLMKIKKVLIAAILHSNQIIVNLAWTLLDSLQFAEEHSEEKASWKEWMQMTQEDRQSSIIEEKEKAHLEFLKSIAPKQSNNNNTLKVGSRGDSKSGKKKTTSGGKSTGKGKNGNKSGDESSVARSTATNESDKSKKTSNSSKTNKKNGIQNPPKTPENKNRDSSNDKSSSVKKSAKKK